MTTNANLTTEAKTIMPLGLTDPSYPDFMKALVRMIAKATKRSAKSAWAGMKSAAKWLDKKLKEGAEIHNRQTQMLEERYARNFYHLRSYL